MPRVGDKTFPYSPAGIRAAQAYSEQVGLPVERPDETSPRNVYQSVTRSVRDRRRRRGDLPANDVERQRVDDMSRRAQLRQPDLNRGDRYGPWGYAGETKREHYDRLWDRDWDEDVRGRRWDPTNRRAGER